MNTDLVKGQLAYVSRERIENAFRTMSVNGKQYKHEKWVLRALQKENEELRHVFEMDDLLSLEIAMYWTKSRTWGRNPYCRAWATYKDGRRVEIKTPSVTSCGYDKASCAMADVFNHFLRGSLYRKRTRENIPYGIDAKWCTFQGGVGLECYNAIAYFLGLTPMIWNRRHGKMDYFYFQA